MATVLAQVTLVHLLYVEEHKRVLEVADELALSPLLGPPAIPPMPTPPPSVTPPPNTPDSGQPSKGPARPDGSGPSPPSQKQTPSPGQPSSRGT